MMNGLLIIWIMPCVFFLEGMISILPTINDRTGPKIGLLKWDSVGNDIDVLILKDSCMSLLEMSCYP